ncbi:MFS transporter [Pontibacter sp. G13]|uniref:MFS transporter n=1 Tax=Pontibacter sp. G13 TaxID=3074898 RepID=UPI00288B575E|nr:MFS transporter [Pontibacter sp. G13]WNJ21610.1 MFS transporter [Pontibacter sp. G13]
MDDRLAQRAHAPLRAGNYRWELLFWLWWAYFLGQADKQVYNVVLTPLRDDLGLTDADMGMVATILLWVLALSVPVAGYLGDRFQRSKVIAWSVVGWASMAILTGFAGHIWVLVAFRSIAVATGEAPFGPSAVALLADWHDRTRSLAFSIFQTSLYVGVIVSGTLAGYVGERWGWRPAFWLFGSVALLLAVVLAFRLRERPPSIPAQPHVSVKLSEAVRACWASPAARWLTLAFSCMVFTGVGFLTWMPTLIHEELGFPRARPGFTPISGTMSRHSSGC